MDALMKFFKNPFDVFAKGKKIEGITCWKTLPQVFIDANIYNKDPCMHLLEYNSYTAKCHHLTAP